MRRIVIQEWMSLDAVVQAPGAPDEDTSGGFPHGGWSLPYFDQAAQEWVVKNLSEAGGFLLGRRTFEVFASYWPNAPEDQQPIAEPMNTKPKYVASTTLTEPLEWQNSSVLMGEVPQAVATLKEEGDGSLLVIGSTKLVHTLIDHDLVDEYRIMIDPLVLGGGKRIFRDDGRLRRLKLVEGTMTDRGAILGTYAPDRG